MLWKWPEPLDQLNLHHLRAAQLKVSAGGPWRKDGQAKDWVGRPISEALGLDPDDKAHAFKIKGALKIWIKNGAFKEVEGKDKKGMPRPFIEVGEWVKNSELPHLQGCGLRRVDRGPQPVSVAAATARTSFPQAAQHSL